MEDFPTVDTSTRAKERFVTRSEQDLCELENAQVEATTAKQTAWVVKLFRGATPCFNTIA